MSRTTPRKPEDISAAVEREPRQPLQLSEAAALLKDTLASRYPAMATLGFELRELIRIQLLTATEEIILRPTELFLGYSVHTQEEDAIVSLTIRSTETLLAFAHDIPDAGREFLAARRGEGTNELRITDAVGENLMILKVLLREAGRAARPRLPSGRTGHCFLVHDPSD